MKKIGLFGGTFNPIHKGHISLCEAAVRELGLDKIFLIPTALPPHKASPELLEDRHRIALCEAAAEEYPFIEVDSFEIDKGGKSYSVDTVTHFKACFPGGCPCV